MQTQTEQLMTKQDILALANELAKIMIEPIKKEVIETLKEANKEVKPLTLQNARDVGKELSISTKRARNLIAMPNFPKNIHGTRGKYKTGPWKFDEVMRFFKINKSKV